MKKTITILLLVTSFISFSQIYGKGSYIGTNYCFNGGGSSLVDLGAIELNSTTWTVCFNTKDYVSTGNYQSITGYDFHYVLILSYGTGLLQYRNPTLGSLTNIGSGYSLIYDDHDVVVRADGTNITIYVDGVDKGTLNATSSLLKVRYIGAYNIFSVYNNNMSLSDFRLYDYDIGNSKALTYHLGTLYDVPDILQFPMSEGYNDICYDVSGNDNHGSITGGSPTTAWAECANHYNENNGVTSVKYSGNTVLVPYLLDGTPLYSSVSPVLNALETAENNPEYLYSKSYIRQYEDDMSLHINSPTGTAVSSSTATLINSEISYYCRFKSNNRPEHPVGQADNEIFSIFNTGALTVTYFIVESNTGSGQDNHLGMGLRDATGTLAAGIHSPSEINLGQIYEVLLTYNNYTPSNTRMRMYIDGVLVDSYTAPWDVYEPSAGVLKLGFFNAYQNADVDVNLFEVRVWDKEIIWSELDNTADLIAQYDLDDETSPIVDDINAINLTISNGLTWQNIILKSWLITF